MNPPTDWASAIAILAAGLVLGLLFVFFFRKRPARTLGGEPDLALKDLHAKRDALIQQLRDPALSGEERTRLELETADVLRQLDAHEPASVTAATAEAPQTGAMNPAVKGFLWGAGSFAALAALGFFVMQQATPREDGGSVTGGMQSQQQQPQQAAAAPDPQVLQMEAAVQRDPNNLQLRNDLAQAYLERDNLMGVFEQTKYVLEKSPNDSRALTFQGLVRLAMGEGPAALQMLQRATQTDPKNMDSWVALAWVYAQGGDMKKAEAMIAEAEKHSPKDKERLEQVFAQMKQHVAEQSAQPAQTASAGELPPGHPPVDGAPAAAPAQSGGASIQLTLDLDPAAKSRNGILYVIARNPLGGPPVAVRRLQATTFPITITFGSADSMMGQPLPDKFRLEARLDSDGDAATKLPTDPAAMQEAVTPGAVVKLSLK